MSPLVEFLTALEVVEESLILNFQNPPKRHNNYS